MKLLKIYLFALCFVSLNILSQTNCGSSAAFCANNSSGTTFPAGTGGSAAAGPDYGCLFTQPNPAWYYFQVSQTGVITIGISGTGGGDVDFICWGPFTSPNGNCANLTAGNTVDCSYSASATETVTINNAIAGEYYQLLITNYSNSAQNINFNQAGGTGSTNCGLIAPVTSATVCSGQTATISANTNLTNPTFSWSPGGQTTQTITVTPGTTTVYTVTVNGLNPASTPTTLVNTGTVTITSATPITVSPSAASICSGQSTVLTASGTGPFVWLASNGAAPPATGIVTVSPSTTTTYTVISGTGSCTTSAVATVSITLSPTISITPTLSTICAGQSAVLTSSGSGPFVWTASSGTNPPASGTVTVSPGTTTTYTVLSGTGTCTSSAVATVSISTTPAIAITPSLSTICAGQSVALTSSGAGPFVWTASSGTNPAAAGTVTVSPITTTTYTVLSGTGTCTATAVATVSISTVPAIAITPSLSTICLGQSIGLSASGSAPFVWTASSGTNPPATASVTVTPTTTTTYTVLSGAGTCTATAVATVSISPVTPITITPSVTSICAGQNVALSTSGFGPFTWAASSGAAPAALGTVTVSPLVTTTYTVLSGTGTCTTTATATINVTTTPTINITPSGTVICTGQSATLTVIGNAGPFVWTASSGANPTPNGTVTVNPSTTTTYSVLAGAGTCTANAVATVSVLPVINPLITASSPSVCLTKTITLNTATAAGLTYTWQPSGAISGANNTSSVSAVPQNSATVIYTVTVSNGVCSSSDTIQVKVLLAPDIKNVTTLNNDTICVGGCVTFSANTTGSAPIFYQWYYQSGVGTSSVGVAPEACYPSAGNFSVVATASNTCGVDTLIKTNFVTVFDLPVLVVSGDTTINIGESATVYADGGLSYSWSPNINGSIACPTCSSTVVQPTLTTQYIVVASNSIYCKVQDTVTVIVDINCGDFFIPNVFSPNGDGLNDLINVHGRCISTFNLQIFNRWGEKVFETSSLSESWDGTFRGQKLDTGVFIYKADGVSIDGQEFKMKGNITLLR